MSRLKSLLKKVFPRILLKRIFLVYNISKAKTWDRFFFPKLKIDEEEFLIFQKKNPFLEMGIDVSRFSPFIQTKLELWTDLKWSQDEYLLIFQEPGFIDPETGWALKKTGELIYPSLGFSGAPHVHKPALLKSKRRHQSAIRFECVISLRDTGEENYFHFYNDVLSKIFFLEDHKIKVEDYTLIISESLYKKPYFQYFLKNSSISKLTFFVQRPDEWIAFDRAIFCKPYTHTKKYFDKVFVLANVRRQSTSKRNIFLTRSTTSLRYVENMRDLFPILKKYDFDVVDSADLEYLEQITLFSECRNLIAVHGAGLTNIIFRNGHQMSILELVQPSPYIPFHYIMLSEMFNFTYDVMMGRKGNDHLSGGFEVDKVEFEVKVHKMISENVE